MRSGPHPLPIHIGMAMSAHKDIREYANSFPSTAQQDVLVEMMRGIQMYQAHPYASDRVALEAAWRNKGSVLYQYPVMQQQNKIKAPPLLLVPSLVNSSSIFNLNQGRSFMGWMREQGIPVYLLDWGALYPDHKEMTMDQVVLELLLPAIRQVHTLTGQKPDVMGYCMGGTLLAAIAALFGDEIGRMVLLAAPWDFQVPHAALSDRVRVWAPFVLPVLAQRGCLPALWTQALFASLDPDATIQKFIRFSEMDEDSPEAKLFIDVEDWLNNNFDLPHAVAQHCMQRWFAANAPCRNEWEVAGGRVDVGVIKNDVMIITSRKDKLVAYESAESIRRNMRQANVQMLEVECGHIGFLAGKNAVEDVWRPVARWLMQK